MNSSVRPQQRCSKALDDILKYLQRAKYDPETMNHLEERYLAASGILETDLYELKQDLNLREAQLFSLLPSLTRYSLRHSYGEHPRLATLNDASGFLRSLYIGVAIEQFYLLALDASGKLIECRLLQKGTIDEAPFYLSHLLQAVVTTGAKAIVLCHNHPGGTKRPSKADIHCTLNALRALYALGVIMLDHVIVADDEAVSLRENGFVRGAIWDSQSSKSKLLAHWLDGRPD